MLMHMHMRAALVAAAAWSCVCSAGGCPESVVVEIVNDGIDYDFTFQRSESFLGQAYALALCHRIFFDHAARSDCDGMCAAQVLADDARRRFLERGCGPREVGGRFDVLQIGAHVGDTRDAAGRLIDPVFKWLIKAAPAHASVLLVEPIRTSFEQLVANVKGARPDVSYLHAAAVPSLADEKEEVAIYNAQPLYDAKDKQGRVADLSQIASLDAGHITNHVNGTFLDLPKGASPRLQRQRVATVDWSLLRSLYGFERLGYLALDVEALDCRLLLAFPFQSFRPHVVSFEHAHCDGPFSRDEDPSTWIYLNRTRTLLAAYGYELADKTEAGDATYVRADAFPVIDFPDPPPWGNVSIYRNGRCKRPWLQWGKRWG